MSTKDEGMETKVERAGNRWVVNTPDTEILISYDQHDTVTRMKIPNQTVFLESQCSPGPNPGNGPIQD